MRIMLITGFGLDRRAFSLLSLPEDGFRTFDLIKPRREESLREYALRMGETMDLRPDDVVGGVSMGGMLALEIARAKGARGIILMASCTHPRFIRYRYLVFSHISMWLPDALVRGVFSLIPAVLKLQGMLSPRGQALLTGIMRAFPPYSLKVLPPKIRRWEGCPPTVPVLRMHSHGDWLIRPDAHAEYHQWIKGKNHLLTVSHPEEVRAFLLRCQEEFSVPPGGGPTPPAPT